MHVFYMRVFSLRIEKKLKKEKYDSFSIEDRKLVEENPFGFMSSF